MDYNLLVTTEPPLPHDVENELSAFVVGTSAANIRRNDMIFRIRVNQQAVRLVSSALEGDIVVANVFLTGLRDVYAQRRKNSVVCRWSQASVSDVFENHYTAVENAVLLTSELCLKCLSHSVKGGKSTRPGGESDHTAEHSVHLQDEKESIRSLLSSAVTSIKTVTGLLGVAGNKDGVHQYLLDNSFLSPEWLRLVSAICLSLGNWVTLVLQKALTALPYSVSPQLLELLKKLLDGAPLQTQDIGKVQQFTSESDLEHIAGYCVESFTVCYLHLLGNR